MFDTIPESKRFHKGTRLTIEGSTKPDYNGKEGSFEGIGINGERIQYTIQPSEGEPLLNSPSAFRRTVVGGRRKKSTLRNKTRKMRKNTY